MIDTSANRLQKGRDIAYFSLIDNVTNSLEADRRDLQIRRSIVTRVVQYVHVHPYLLYVDILIISIHDTTIAICT